MSLSTYIADLKKALAGLSAPVREGPLERFISVHADSYHEVILVSDTDGITEEPQDSLDRAVVTYPITIDVYVKQAPNGKDDEAIIRAREIFDLVFPALHDLHIFKRSDDRVTGSGQITDIEGGRMVSDEINDGHYQARCNLVVFENYVQCR